MNRIRSVVIAVLMSTVALLSVAQEVDADSIAPLKGNWVHQLVASGYNINDPRINYPRFANFCRKVYNWGNATFNSYDSTYVVSTGKNWKASLKSYNWMQSYVYNFSIKDADRVWLRSGISTDIGVSVNFMALSIGYTWNLNTWMRGEHDRRNTFNFSVTTSLFTAELTSSDNDTHGRIFQFGNDDNSEIGKNRYTVPVSHKSLTFNAYYFFNHREYSYAAAYCFSKYQKKSAGTWLLGFEYNRQRINIDFTELPSEALEAMPELPLNAYYKYRDYNVMGGYAHNFVIRNKWLINLTVLPAMGYKSMPHRSDNHLEMLSLAGMFKAAVTYNHRALFASMQVSVDGNFLLTSKYSFMNSTECVTAFIGLRF